MVIPGKGVLVIKEGRVRFEPALLECLRDGDNLAVLEIMNEMDSTIIDGFQKTLIHHAINYNNKEIIEYFLHKGFNIDQQDQLGNTPLLLALSIPNDRMSEPIVEMLCKAGADLFIKNKYGAYPLKVAMNPRWYPNVRDILPVYNQLVVSCRNTSSSIAESLHKAECPLGRAVCLASVDVIESLLKEHETRIDQPMPFTLSTALHIAVQIRHGPMTLLLVRHMANLSARDVEGRIPLSFYKPPLGLRTSYSLATNVEWTPGIISHLIDANVDLTGTDYNGRFYIECLFIKGKKCEIRELLKHPINFQARDKCERTAVHLLAINTANIADLIKDKTFDVDATDSYGITPLFHSIPAGNSHLVRLLLARRADVDIRPQQMNPALLYAIPRAGLFSKLSRSRARKCVRTLKALLQNNVDPQTSNILGKSSLEFVSKETMFALAKPIIAHIVINDCKGVEMKMKESVADTIHQNEHLHKYYLKCLSQINSYKTIYLTDKNSEEPISKYDLLVELDQYIIEKCRKDSNIISLLKEFIARKNGHNHVYYIDVIKKKILRIIPILSQPVN